MKSQKLVLIAVVVFLLSALIGYNITSNEDEKIPNESAVVHQQEIDDTDWCVVCVEQEPLYYKFCMVEIGNGNIKMPEGDWTPSEFCEVMADFEKQLCLSEDCKK